MNKKYCNYCKKEFPTPGHAESNSHWFWQKDDTRKGGGNFICNVRRKEYQKKYKRTKSGWARITYHTQVKSSRYRNHPKPDYTMNQFKEWAFSQHNFDRLYNNWVESGYDQDNRPSADRIDDYKPYTLDNLRLVTYLENRLSGVNSDKAKIAYKKVNAKQGVTVYCYTKELEYVSKFKSAHQANRETGIDQSSIIKCCKGKYKTAGGYKWFYQPI